MRKAALAALTLAAPVQGLACGTLPDGYNFKHADYVVEGTISCPVRGDACEIRVREHFKGITATRIALPGRFAVKEETQDYRDANVLGCGERFTPRLSGHFDGEAFSFYGEFSLRRNKDDGLYRVRGFKVRDHDGEFIEGGLRCTPIPNDEGRRLSSCEGIIRRASTFASAE